jgi:hypothetical protein
MIPAFFSSTWMILLECHESPADFEVPTQQGPRTPHHSWVDYDGEHHAGMGNGTHNLLSGGHESLPPSQGPWCLVWYMCIVFKVQVCTCISMWRASKESSHFTQTFLQRFTKKWTWYWLFCIEYGNSMMSQYIEEVHAMLWCTKIN